MISDTCDSCALRFNSEVKTARIKDFERLIYTLTIFNIDPNNSIYKNVIEEIRNTSRAQEISE